jgi:probable F420-dependent oxidoreductase
MRIGVVFPHESIGTNPAAISAFAQEAERLGFSHIIGYDHVLGADLSGRNPPIPHGIHNEKTPFRDPFVLFGFLAARTEEIQFSTGVMVLPQRPTALVAKQAADVQLLSGGRLRLGIGVGYNHVEYQAMGADYESRGRRIEEQVEVLRQLWRDPTIDFTGTFHRIDRAGICPRPTGHNIPLWFGGSSVQVKRACRIGDGFIWFQLSRATSSDIRLAHKLLEEEGRNIEGFGTEVILTDRLDELPRKISLWAELGGSHASIVLAPEMGTPMQALRRCEAAVRDARK